MEETIATNNAVFTKLAELIAAATDIPLEKVTPEANFQDLGMDSLDALALISDLEEEYKIKIPNQEILKIKTVGMAMESISKRIE